MKTNNSTRHNREILSSQYSISRLLFTELSLSLPSYVRGSKAWSHPILKLRVQEAADPLRPLTEWDLVFVLSTGKEYGPQSGLGSTIQLESCDSLRARIAHKEINKYKLTQRSRSCVSRVIEYSKKIN